MSEIRTQNTDYRRQNAKGKQFCFLFFALGMLVFAGCAAQIQKPVKICPGKASVAESLSSLMVQLENAVPLKADGQCLLQYYTEEGKLKKENFPVKLWVNPPAEIYMQGDVAFDPKGVVLGSNKEEFWLAVRLKEVSGYWRGRWSKKEYSEKLMISPRLVLEALGAAAVGNEEGWSLSNEGAFDVLTKQQDGVEAKKIYINNCDYLVGRIEYFEGGRTAVVMEQDKYKKISKNFFVPGIVKIATLSGGGKGESVQITLGAVKQVEFTEKQRERLFVRPREQGFRQIYEIVDGKVVEQPK